MNKLRGFLGINRIDKVSNERIRKLCGVTKGLNERIEEGVLQWFGHVERMENDRIAKRKCAGCGSVGRPRERWIDTVKEG